MFVEQIALDRDFSHGGGGERERKYPGPDFSFSQRFLDKIRCISSRFEKFPTVEPEDIHVVPIVATGSTFGGKELSQAIVIAKNGCLIGPAAPISMTENDSGEVVVDLSGVIDDWPYKIALHRPRLDYYSTRTGDVYDFGEVGGEELQVSIGETTNKPRIRLCVFVTSEARVLTDSFDYIPSAVNLVSIETDPRDLEIKGKERKVAPIAPSPTTVFQAREPVSATVAAPIRYEPKPKPPSRILTLLRENPQRAYAEISNTVKGFPKPTSTLGSLPNPDRIAALGKNKTPVGIRIDEERREITFDFLYFNIPAVLTTFLVNGKAPLLFDSKSNCWMSMTLSENGSVRVELWGTTHDGLPSLAKRLSRVEFLVPLYEALKNDYPVIPESSGGSTSPIPPPQRGSEPPVPSGQHKNVGKPTRDLKEEWRRQRKKEKGGTGKKRWTAQWF